MSFLTSDITRTQTSLQSAKEAAAILPYHLLCAILTQQMPPVGKEDNYQQPGYAMLCPKTVSGFR